MENEEKQRYLSSYQQYLTDKNKNVNIQNNEKENKENIFEIENMAPQNQQSLNAKHKKKTNLKFIESRPFVETAYTPSNIELPFYPRNAVRGVIFNSNADIMLAYCDNAIFYVFHKKITNQNELSII